MNQDKDKEWTKRKVFLRRWELPRWHSFKSTDQTCTKGVFVQDTEDANDSLWPVGVKFHIRGACLSASPVLTPWRTPVLWLFRWKWACLWVEVVPREVCPVSKPDLPPQPSRGVPPFPSTRRVACRDVVVTTAEKRGSTDVSVPPCTQPGPQVPSPSRHLSVAPRVHGVETAGHSVQPMDTSLRNQRSNPIQMGALNKFVCFGH